MNISAIATIRVEIDGQKFDMTKDDAEKLYTALGRALNKNDIFQYPPGVRGPVTSPAPVIGPITPWPTTAPNTTPYSPPYTITCSTIK